MVSDPHAQAAISTHQDTKPVMSAEMSRDETTRYLSIINQQSDLVCRYSPGLLLTFVNDAFCAFFGIPREALLGTALPDLFPTFEVASFQEALRRLSPEAPEYISERYAVAGTGVDHWQQWQERAIWDADGQVVEYQAIGRDITTQKFMEAQLHEREERYRAIVSNAAMGICLVDAYGQFIECNPALVQMSGYLPEDLSMLTLPQVTWPEDWEQEQEQFLALWRSQATGYRLEKRIITSEGTCLWIQAMTTLICGPDNQPQYMVQLWEDISPRKEAERIRGEYEEQLRALSLKATLADERERRRIAQNLHDQIGQSLAIARMQLGKISALMDTGQDDMHREIEETRALLSEALDYSRTVTCELSPPILHELGLVPALRWLASHFTDRYRLPTQLHTEGPITALTLEERIVLYHTTRELLFNVVKHAHASQAHLRIRPVEAMVELIVDDDGEGFSPSDGQMPADGFGLFSVRERIGHMGGALDIETGHWGTRCRIRIPVSTETSTEEYGS